MISNRGYLGNSNGLCMQVVTGETVTTLNDVYRPFFKYVNAQGQLVPRASRNMCNIFNLTASFPAFDENCNTGHLHALRGTVLISIEKIVLQ